MASEACINESTRAQHPTSANRGRAMKVFALLLTLLASATFVQELYDALLHHWDYDKLAPLNIKQIGLQKRDGISI